MRRFLPRLLIALGVLGGAHYYIWQRFVDATALPAPWRTLASIAIVIAPFTFIATAIVMRRASRERAKPLAWIAYTWFGLATYLLLGAWGSHIAVAFGANARIAGAIGAGAAVLTVLYGFANVARGPIVRRVRIPLANLPREAEGYTIAQLTDVHIGPTLGRDFAEKVRDRVNALDANLVVLTGDLVDGHLAELRDHVAPLGELRGRDGVFAITGNHEYYWDAAAWLDHWRSLGVRILRNEHVTIRPSHTNLFTLAGVDDHTGHSMLRGHGEDIPTAIADRDPTIPVVLLAHHPSAIPRAQAAGIDLQLSGHTHGGQLLPLGWLSRLFEPHVAGLARFGATWLYVSEGTGYWGPPMRVGTSCEITLITLARA